MAAAAPGPGTYTTPCAGAVLDQSSGICIPASSIPLMGTLYPLGNEFMIDGLTGYVGIGTTTPGYALEVVGQIVSGIGCTATGATSSIGGGVNNNANGDTSTISGGMDNTGSGQIATVSGGGANGAIGIASTVSGGSINGANGDFSVVSGGGSNDAGGYASTISGGGYNTSPGDYSTISGGVNSSVTGSYGVISGGWQNNAGGHGSVVPGGLTNRAMGEGSFAAGRRSNAEHTGAFVWSGSASAFSSTAVEQFLIDASGGVGIGTNAPDGAMHVVQAAAGNGLTVDVTDPGSVQYGIKSTNEGSGGIGVLANVTSSTGSTVGLLASCNSPDGNAGLFNNSGGGVAGQFVSSGIAGQFIGKVEAAGAIRSFGASGGALVAHNPNNESASVNLSWLNDVARIRTGGTGAGASGGLDIQRGGNASSLRILGNGDVGIGSTTPSEKLDVAGNIRCVSLIQTSDARYKQNVKDVDGALDSILALRGVSYDWNLDKFPQGGTDRQLGFLAQEVRDVLPEAVREDEQGMLALSYTSVIPVLVEAVRELDEENQKLAKRNQELTARLVELEALNSRLDALEEAFAITRK